MDQLIQLCNRLAGIAAWVGTWNLLLMVVKEEDPLGNTLLMVGGIIFWYYTGEFTGPDNNNISRSLPENTV